MSAPPSSPPSSAPSSAIESFDLPSPDFLSALGGPAAVRTGNEARPTPGVAELLSAIAGAEGVRPSPGWG